MSIFSSVPIFVPKTNKLNLSYQNLLTTSFGKETPSLLEECLPGDIFKVKSEIFCRFQPLLAPIMDMADVSLHYFFIPTRLMFENFYKFLCDEEIMAGVPAVIPFAYLDEIAEATFNYLYPDITPDYDPSTGLPIAKHIHLNCTLMDYLGLPTQQFTFTVDQENTGLPITITHDVPHIPVNFMPFIAYYLVHKKYYRDENLTDVLAVEDALRECRTFGGDVKSYAVSTGGTLLDELVKLRLRGYKKDYFTSALPWAQKGEDVVLPVGQQDVEFYGENMNGHDVIATNKEGAQYRIDLLSGNDGTDPITAKTSGLSSASINDLRTAMRVQQLLENNARGGTRQQEFIKAHWGVYAKDARINDPEYIGGSSAPVGISQVLSQVASQNVGVDGNNLGQMAGQGISSGFGISKKYRVTEHGYLLAVLSVMPRASYFQGIPRMYSHLERYDFFFPELSHLGEQEIKNKELMCEPVTENGADMEGTFGYTPRYAEYKYHPNEVHGDFRDTLRYWHLARIFDYLPGLNNEFIEVNPANQGQNRIFSYVDDDFDQILVQIYHHNPMLRRMPYYGIPKF